MYHIITWEQMHTFLQSSIRTSPFLKRKHTEGLILIPSSRASWRQRVLRWGYAIISPWDLQSCAQIRAVTRRVPSSFVCVCVCVCVCVSVIVWKREWVWHIQLPSGVQFHGLYSHPDPCLGLTGYWMVYPGFQNSSANSKCELKPFDSANL